MIAQLSLESWCHTLSHQCMEQFQGGRQLRPFFEKDKENETWGSLIGSENQRKLIWVTQHSRRGSLRSQLFGTLEISWPLYIWGYLEQPLNSLNRAELQVRWPMIVYFPRCKEQSRSRTFAGIFCFLLGRNIWGWFDTVRFDWLDLYSLSILCEE